MDGGVIASFGECNSDEYYSCQHIDTVMVDDLAYFKNVQNVGIKSTFTPF